MAFAVKVGEVLFRVRLKTDSYLVPNSANPRKLVAEPLKLKGFQIRKAVIGYRLQLAPREKIHSLPNAPPLPAAVPTTRGR